MTIICLLFVASVLLVSCKVTDELNVDSHLLLLKQREGKTKRQDKERREGEKTNRQVDKAREQDKETRLNPIFHQTFFGCFG